MNSSTDLEYYRRVDFDRIYGYEQHGYAPILSFAKWRKMIGDLVKSEHEIIEDTNQQIDESDVILIDKAKEYITKLKSLGVSHIQITCLSNGYSVVFSGVSEHEIPYTQRDYEIKYEAYAKAIIDENSKKWAEYVASLNEKKLMLSLIDKYPDLAKSRLCT